ncbi:hypothetical protein GIB67_032126, partial [Kingdonia uniflora]
ANGRMDEYAIFIRQHMDRFPEKSTITHYPQGENRYADALTYIAVMLGQSESQTLHIKVLECPSIDRMEANATNTSVSQGRDYLYLLPDLAKEKKCRRLGDEVSLEYVQGVVKDSQTDGFCCNLAQFDYGLTMPLSNLAKSVMNMIGACPAQLNCNFWEVILVCETLNERWAASATDGAYLSSSSSRPCFLDLSSAGRVWNDNLLWVAGECLQQSDVEPLELNNRTITKGINCKVSRKESFIDVVAWEGTDLEAVLKELVISRFKRVATKDDKVRRSQAKRRMAGKTLGSVEVKLPTLELNIPLKLERLNEMPDGPVDMATVSCTIENDKITEGADLRLHFEVEASLLEEQYQAKAREKMVTALDGEFRKNNLTGKLNQLRYIKVEIMSFSEGNYEEKEIMAEEEVEEMEDGLNVAEETVADNQETINQKELDVAREREEQTLLYNAKYGEEYEALISQYEDRLNDNVKLSLKLEEAKRQVEDKTATILSSDLALNQLTSELA